MVRMRKVSLGTALFAMGLLAGAASGDVVSDPITILTDTAENAFWRTARSNAFDLQWDFPRGATKATLTVKGVKYETRHEDLTQTSINLQLPAPTVKGGENVYELTLAFDNGDVLTESIGVIAGVADSGQSGAIRIANPSSQRWSRCRSVAVMPIPADATSLTVDGQPVDGLDGTFRWFATDANATTPRMVAMTDGAGVHEAGLLSVGGLFIVVK